MKIFNIMLSRGLGGIQQAFLDYNHALTMEGFDVINITSFRAKINQTLPNTCKLPNLGIFDIFSILYLKLLIKFHKPDLIIAHGNRAIAICRRPSLPLIGVAHNYKLQGLKKCDYVIALTEHMLQHLAIQGFNKTRIVMIPNMIYLNQELIKKNFKHPITIGTIARFVPKKGIDIFLHALLNLKKGGYLFKALIGGDGEEKDNLIRLIKKLGLNNEVKFIGWVEDKINFFKDIDIFCLPSIHEPFGIIILEAMASCTPIVATKTEGPSEIIRDLTDGILYNPTSSDDLAEKLVYLLTNPIQAKAYAQSSYLRLKENYDINLVAKKLSIFLKSIIKT